MSVFLFIIVSIIAKHAAAVDFPCYAGPDFPICSDASCGGTCDPSNECSCGDGFTTCVPTDCVMGTNNCCDMLTGWYYDTSKPCCTQEFRCNPACGSDEDCVRVNDKAVCQCNVSLYSGKVPADLKPTVECSGGIMTTSFSKCMLKALGFDSSTTHLINETTDCIFSYPEIRDNIRYENFQVQAASGWCGNIVTNDSTTIHFTNTITINANSGPLITKNPISFNFSCIYNNTMQTSLDFVLHPITSTIVIPPASGVGAFTVTLAAYIDETCTVPLQETDTLYVGSDLYLGLFSPDLDANAFALRVETCFATPVNDTASSSKVILVEGGCAYDDGVPTNVLENGVSSEARIKFNTFMFEGQPGVFVFCNVIICNKTEDCSKCNTIGGRADTVYTGLGIQLKLEDIINNWYSNSGHVTGVSWSLLASTLLAYFYMKSF